MMRVTMMFLLALAGAQGAAAQDALPAVKQLQVRAQAGVKELVCEKRPTAKRPPRAPNPDPMEIPNEELLPDLAPVKPASMLPPSFQPDFPGAGYRVAVWGDSHLAAGFFTDELMKVLNVPAGEASNVLLPANMGRPGVRLPIRRACVSPQWKYEPGYLGRDNAVAPGPGLMNMSSDQPGATLAWDLRKDAGSPGVERVRVLYQQTAAPLQVALSVDGGAEQQVTLDSRAGPATLELVGDKPVTQVKLRLLDGSLRLHGLETYSRRAHSFEMDVFGYPGATVAGWKSANLDYLRSWFAQRPYQMVVLAFGTNEGNAAPFNLAGYRDMLRDAVRNMRTLFPAATCVLIAPGDRGVLVPRSSNVRPSKGRKGAPRPAVDLLRYSRIHADIAQAQRDVAMEAGCAAWSMLDAMGGAGQSYRWAQQSPPLMARDLIHFTAAGYRHLAREFATDMGWVPLPAATPGGAEAAQRLNSTLF